MKTGKGLAETKIRQETSFMRLSLGGTDELELLSRLLSVLGCPTKFIVWNEICGNASVRKGLNPPDGLDGYAVNAPGASSSDSGCFSTELNKI